MLEVKCLANTDDCLELDSKVSIEKMGAARLRILVSNRPNSISKVKHRSVRKLPIDVMPDAFVYGSQMIFIDGIDKRQVAWALKESLKESSILVFLGGELLKELGCKNIDSSSAQQSDLASVFNIISLPSVVRCEGGANASRRSAYRVIYVNNISIYKKCLHNLNILMYNFARY